MYFSRYVFLWFSLLCKSFYYLLNIQWLNFLNVQFLKHWHFHTNSSYFRPIKLRFSQNWFISCFLTGDPRYVPNSCCRYPGDLYNLTNCVGLRDRDRRQAPAGGPPVLHVPSMRNDQLFTKVGLSYKSHILSFVYHCINTANIWFHLKYS